MESVGPKSDQSVRPFLRLLSERDDLVRIERALDRRFELSAALALLDHGPAVVADRVSGHPHPVVANILGTRERVAQALGVRKAEVLDRLQRAAVSRTPVEVVADAPCQERVLAAETAWDEAIAPTFFEKDSGPYVTAGAIMAHDPVTGHRNASYARIRPESTTTGFIGIAPNHHLARMARSAATAGRKLPVAVTLGTHPAIQLASCFYLGLGDDELEHAATLLGEPVRVVRAKTSDVLVPADAEIVIEGLIDIGKTIHEGLTSEYHGMYEDYGPGFSFEVTAVTTRRDPLTQVVLPGLASEHANLAALPIAAGLKVAVERAGIVVHDLAVGLSGGGRVDVVLSLSRDQARHARRAILACFASGTILKQVTVVDDDVDVWDAEHVQWARTTFLRWDKDLVVLPEMGADRNVPMQVGGTLTKVGMDATGKPGSRAIGTDRAVPPRDVVTRLERWLVEDGLADRIAPTPVIRSFLESETKE